MIVCLIRQPGAAYPTLRRALLQVHPMKFDPIHAALKFVSYNRFTVVGVAAVLYLGGCAFFPPKGPSIQDPKVWVPEAQLDAEYLGLQAKYKASKAVIAAQREAWNRIGDVLLQTVQNVPTPYTGLITTGLSILGVGATADGLRRRSITKSLTKGVSK